jgi:hypothetical protein
MIENSETKIIIKKSNIKLKNTDVKIHPSNSLFSPAQKDRRNPMPIVKNFDEVAKTMKTMRQPKQLLKNFIGQGQRRSSLI